LISPPKIKIPELSEAGICGRNLEQMLMIIVRATFYFVILNSWEGGVMSRAPGKKGKIQTARKNHLKQQASTKESAYNM
jgi:hypothetical protein